MYMHTLNMAALTNINFDTMEDESALFSSNSNTTSATTTPIQTQPPPVTELSFEEKVKQLIANNVCVYILTPCYGGMCHVDYMYCLMATVEKFRMFGI